MRVGVLGPLVAIDGDKQLRLGGPKQRAVLALLVASSNTVVSVATLIDGVWGDRAPGAVESSLQSYVSHLRSDAGLKIDRIGDGYRLQVDESVSIDALEFERGINRALEKLDGDPSGADEALRSALELWRGRPYCDLPAMEELGPEVARLEHVHRAARELKVDVHLALGNDEDAVRAVDELVADDPFSESLRAKQMTALYRLGRQAAALALYQSVRRKLIDELGIEPGPQLRDVERRILIQDPELRLGGPGGPGSPSRNPYKGAEPFTEEDANDFFGRDAEVDELVALVSQHRLSLLVGPSGSGKSSLARAGLLPALGTATGDVSTWATAVIRPGRDPVVALRQAVRRVREASADERLVVIDQFEETYSLIGVTDRRRFVDLLLDVAGERNAGQPNGDHIRESARILLTLRADFLHLPLMDGRLGPCVQAATMVLSVPSAANLAKAVDGPAANVGLVIEPIVTAQIVADVEGQAAALPLLQFTLTELAQASGNARVDLAAYRRHGGVRGAIGQRAASVYEELDGDAKRATRRILLHLVTLVDEGAVVRRQVPRLDLERLELPIAIVDRVLNRFVGARLLAFDHDPVTGAATVEVSHEAILQEWMQLAGWIEEHRQNLRVRHRFQAAFAEWLDSGRAEDLLLDRTRLDQFRSWAADPDNMIAAPEQEFLDQGIRRLEHREYRRRHRRRLLTGSSLVVAVAMTLLAIVAAVNARAAGRQSDLAAARALTTEAEGNIDVDPELAIMLAVEALSLHDDPDEAPSRLTDVLRRALAANKVLGQLPGGRVLAIDPSEDRLFTAGDRPGELSVWDLMTRESLGTIIVADEAAVEGIDAVGKDRLIARLRQEDRMSVVVVELRWDGAELEDPAIQEQVAVVTREDEWISSVVSPDGRWMAVTSFIGPSSEPGSIAVWDLERAERLHVLDDVWSDSAAFSPDGRLLAHTRTSVAGPGKSYEVAIVNVATGEDEAVLTSPSFLPLAFSFSPDQTLLAYNDDNQVGLVDLESDVELWRQGEVSRAFITRWSPDGAVVIVGGEGLMSRLSAVDGSLSDAVVGDRGLVHDLDLVAGGSLLAVAGDDRVTLLDLSSTPRAELAGGFASPLPTTWSVSLDATGEVLLQSFDEYYAVQTTSGEILVHEPWHSAPNTWQFPVANRDGTFLAGFVGDENLLWASPSMDVAYRSPPEWSIRAVADDGALVAVSREAEPARLVAVQTGEILHELDVGLYLHSAVFLENDAHLFTSDNGPGGREHTWRIWDTRSGELVNELDPGGDEHSVAFTLTQDGKQLVAGANDGTVAIYSVAELLTGATLADALVRRIDAHDQLIIQVSVSPDNRFIASNSWDEPAKVWELGTGRLVEEFGGSGQVTGIAFHPTDPYVFVHEQGRVSIHTLDRAELAEIAMGTVTRKMTEAECQQYFGRRCDS